MSQNGSIPYAFGGDGVVLAAIGWAGALLSIIAVVLRSYAASKLNGKWRWDYIWSVVTVITTLAAWVVCFRGTLYGLGNDLSKLSPAQAFQVLKHVWYTVYIGVVAITVAKFSVVALLLQVQGVTGVKRNIALWVVAALFTAVNFVQLFLAIFQCNPVEKLWYPFMEGTCNLTPTAVRYNYFQGAVGALTDFVLAVWPVSLLWNLKMSKQVKIGICLLMALGTLPGIASIMRAVNVPRSREVNPTKQVATFMLWCILEIYSIIILTSIPVLRHLFMRVIKGKRDSTNAFVTEISRRSTGSRPKSRTTDSKASGKLDMDDTDLETIELNHSKS